MIPPEADPSEKQEPRILRAERRAVGSRGAALYFLKTIRDDRGSLSVAELEESLPFEVRRIFYIYDVPGAQLRGEHAHRECHQFLICLRGSVTVLTDDGESREEVLLNDPRAGLHVPPMVWAEQHNYSADAVLMVLASHPYDADDYIRNREDFLEEGRGSPTSWTN